MTSPLDPATWPEEAVAELTSLANSLRGPTASGSFATACVVASTGPFAAYAGNKALEAGGSAVDAAIATALTQIAAAAGSWVSYAGIFSMVHFESSTGEVTTLDGGYNSFREENDPLSIPFSPSPSGRTAMVGGFFAAVHEAHQRFGRLPWADLFLPALWIADGMVVGDSLAGAFTLRKDVLERSPQARAALLSDGKLPVAGDILRQPELARTLRIVVKEGASYLYTGAWAERFVALVREAGGKVTLEDLRNYKPRWSAPLKATSYGHDIAVMPAPHYGGAALIEALKVAEDLNIGDSHIDPEALHLLAQVGRTHSAFIATRPIESRTTDEHARAIAKQIQIAGTAPGPSEIRDGSHSDFVCAVDKDGNAVAICHTINSLAWGATGIFVDGISIPDSASFQQYDLAKISPGDRLPHMHNPAIVLKGGRPVLVSSSIGAGLHPTTVSCVHRHLAHGVPVAEAVNGVLMHGLDPGMALSDSINNDAVLDEAPHADAKDAASQSPQSASHDDLLQLHADAVKQAVESGRDLYEDATLQMRDLPVAVTGTTQAHAEAVAALGTALTVFGPQDAAFARGYWGGIAIDPITGVRHGARTDFVNSRVEGH